MESKGLRRKTKLNALFLFVVFILIYRKFDSRASNRFNQFALLPSLIYNRTLRAAEHTRHRFLLFGSAEPEIDPVTLVENYKKIEERFNRRRIFLKEHCENLNLNGSLAANVHHDGSALDAIWNNVLADMEFPSQDQTKRNSFFGCIPPESGFTVFSAWFFDVYHPEEEFNQRGREEIKQRMNKISDDERIRLLTNDETLRFLVVRHPMTRFVSSWDDHFCPECEIGKSILKGNPALAELASRWQFDGDEYQVRFDLLAKYLVERGSHFDQHFKNQAEACSICQIDYKYIIKLETLHEDLSYLIAKLNRLDNTKELVSPETISKNKNINLYRYYFNTLNFDLLKKLVNFYETDSKLLNYGFDYTKRAIGGWD